MAPLKHGHTIGKTFTPEYRAYVAMKNRCLNPNQARFKDYGERGITICARWLQGEDGLNGFHCFLADMGRKPSPKHSLDRRENDLGYFPANCKWATRSEQARNTRKTTIVNVAGEFMPVADAADYFGGPSYNSVRRRIALGWDAEAAVLTPIGEPPIQPLELCF